jgi:hypothetical protein
MTYGADRGMGVKGVVRGGWGSFNKLTDSLPPLGHAVISSGTEVWYKL